MKSFVPLILWIVHTTIASAADPELQAFAEKVAAAKAAKDIDTLMSMYYAADLSDEDKQKMREQVEFAAKHVRSEPGDPPTIEPVPEEMADRQPRVYNGERIEPTLPATGVIQITFPNGKSMTPFGMKDGKPWLIGTKRIKLNWNGPPEDPYTIGVNNSGDQPVSILIEATFRGSGVDQTLKKKITVPAKGSHGAGMRANDLLSVRMTCDEPATKLSAYIKKQAGTKTEDIVSKSSFDATHPFTYSGAVRSEK